MKDYTEPTASRAPYRCELREKEPILKTEAGRVKKLIIRLLLGTVSAVLGSLFAFYAAGFLVGPFLLIAKPFMPDQLVEPAYTFFRGTVGWISIIWGGLAFWWGVTLKE